MAQVLPLLIGAQIVGTGLSAMAQYRAGQAQEAAYELGARTTERETAQQEFESRRRTERMMASQRALYAKAGVDITSGSPLMILAETAGEGEREAQIIRDPGCFVPVYLCLLISYRK